MSIRAVIFDIGGVLELTPDLDVDKKWEAKLRLKSGELNERLGDVWKKGSLGTISLEQVHENIAQIMSMSTGQVKEFMDDVWCEYLGTLNVELVDYFCSLRPRYRTAIISNSFVGAREKEEKIYHFSELCDFIIYSHEVGLLKPDLRIFTLACERLSLWPSEVIFVDDHEEVMVSARELGIHCVQFRNNEQVIAAVESYIQANA